MAKKPISPTHSLNEPNYQLKLWARMVASCLPKTSGDARSETKPDWRVGYLCARVSRPIFQLAALGFVFIQSGCAVVDLDRSENYFGLAGSSAAVQPSSDCRPEKLEPAKGEPHFASQSARLIVNESAFPVTEKPLAGAAPRNETSFSVPRRLGKSVAEQLLASASKESFAWKPQLLIRANDELNQPAEEVDEPGVDIKNLSNAPPSLSAESESPEMLDGIEYARPESDGEVAFEFGRERWRRVKSDYQNFYSQSSLIRLSGAFLIGAAMANTAFDENFTEDVYRDNVIDIANEDIAQTLHQPKTLGDGYILLPTLGVLAVSQPLLERSEWTSPLGELGDRGARAILVGGPVVMITQNLTGASRPYEAPSGSRWVPFQDNNGVSGHAFVGAVPFLAAGKMSRQPWAKAVWYGASVLPAISRVNDDRHYFSQVFLGWYIAWLATNGVDDSIQRPGSLRVAPMWGAAGPGLMLEKQF